MAPFDMGRQTISPIAVFNTENKKMHRVAMFLLHPKASKNVERCFFLRVDVYQVQHLIRPFLSRVEETICLGFSTVTRFRRFRSSVRGDFMRQAWVKMAVTNS